VSLAIPPARHSESPNPGKPVPHAYQQAYRWSRDNYSPLLRAIDVWGAVIQFLIFLQIDSWDWSYPGGKTEAALQKRRRERAAWLREAMLRLGPTFIKVGQLLSTRADVLPAESVEELAKLQDRVPAFRWEQARHILETDLGKPLEELFQRFDPVPIAAASLGQVYKAQLLTGEEVAVKVQRPGLLKLFAIDLGILRRIAEYFQKHPKYGPGRDWVGIYEECRKILYEEADYLNEGRNADRFRRNFRGDDRIRAPRIYWRYASTRVLTLEYLPGIKISNYEALTAAGIDRGAVARLAAEAYLRQLLESGFFHADPHPGNLAVSPEGHLIFYDFGMMGQIKPITREKLVGVFLGIARKDADLVVSALVDLGALELKGDPGPVRRAVQYTLDNTFGPSLAKQSMGTIQDDLYELAYDRPFRFPATFTFVLRALSTLEGLGRGLDAGFNFMEIAQPYVLALMENGNGNGWAADLWGEFGKQAATLGNSAMALPGKIDVTLDKLERGDLRVRVRSQETDRLLRRLIGTVQAAIYGLFGAASLVSATMLFIHQRYGWAVGVVGLGLWCVTMVWRTLSKLEKQDRMFS